MILIRKFKSMASLLMALSFFVAITLSACGTTETETEDTETTTEEQVSESNEHPSDGEEHASDSTATENEHPSEHPDN